MKLNKTTNKIYVTDAKLFRENAIGTKRFSITVTDNCGITTCKEVTLIIGDDSPAVYVDVKNNSYLNSLKFGDVIGYPVDPDGSITKAELIYYNKAAGSIGSLVDPKLELPPGTSFNKYTGEIRVTAMDNTAPTKYFDGKTAIKKGTDGGPKSIVIHEVVKFDNNADTKKGGKQLFFGEDKTHKTSGVANSLGNWDSNSASTNSQPKLLDENVSNDSLKIASGLVNVDKSPVGSLVDGIVSNSVWIQNSGQLAVGKWTIHVLTTDQYEGTTIIEYLIEIKKNTIITGVLGNLGYTGHVTMKKKIQENYSNILKATIDEDVTAFQGLDQPKDSVNGFLPNNLPTKKI